MIVRIVRCSGRDYWYKDYVNHVFEVEMADSDFIGFDVRLTERAQNRMSRYVDKYAFVKLNIAKNDYIILDLKSQNTPEEATAAFEKLFLSDEEYDKKTLKEMIIELPKRKLELD